jgi:hypothetical protein
VRHSPLVVIVVLLALAAGCGGSGTPENMASVNQIQTFADQQLALRLDANQGADPFTCEQDGDPQHWTCTTEVRTDNPDDENADDEVVPLTVNVTCDAAASCIYEPET